MKRKIGIEAEEIVKNFLEDKGFEVISKNFWIKRFGEIDLIAKKDKEYYFIEVKSLKNNKNFDPSIHYDSKKKKKFHSLVNYYVNKFSIEKFHTLLITVSFKEKPEIKVYKNV
jgi:Holliday junction resolvase-like predicted endonuclease